MVNRYVHFEKVASLSAYSTCTSLNAHFTSIKIYVDKHGYTEKEMAAPSSVLTYRIPWAEEPTRLQPWGCKELDTTEVTE